MGQIESLREIHRISQPFNEDKFFKIKEMTEAILKIVFIIGDEQYRIGDDYVLVSSEQIIKNKRQYSLMLYVIEEIFNCIKSRKKIPQETMKDMANIVYCDILNRKIQDAKGTGRPADLKKSEILLLKRFEKHLLPKKRKVVRKAKKSSTPQRTKARSKA